MPTLNLKSYKIYGLKFFTQKSMGIDRFLLLLNNGYYVLSNIYGLEDNDISIGEDSLMDISEEVHLRNLDKIKMFPTSFDADIKEKISEDESFAEQIRAAKGDSATIVLENAVFYKNGLSEKVFSARYFLLFVDSIVGIMPYQKDQRPDPSKEGMPFPPPPS